MTEIAEIPTIAGVPQWTPAMSVGVPEIDEDHRLLIDLIGQMHVAGTGFEAQAVMGSVLAALLDYTDYHFEREERMMAALGMAALQPHRKKHLSLRRSVKKLFDEYRRDPGELDVGEVTRFLQGWLLSHILNDDMGYKAAAAASPEVARRAAASLGVDFFLRDDTNVARAAR